MACYVAVAGEGGEVLLTELALLAASTASRYCPRLMKHRANLALLLIFKIRVVVLGVAIVISIITTEIVIGVIVMVVIITTITMS